MCRVLFLLVTVVLISGCGETGRESVQEKIMTEPLLAFVKKHADKYVLTRDDITYTVIPAVGGRIESLQFQGSETLLTPEPGSDNLNQWGNVFWPSPQADWGWPPAPAFDNEPYKVSANKDFLILTSAIEPKTQLQFEKHYGFSKASNSVHIRYRVYNRSDKSTKFAPWEVTRFPAAGVSFYPTGTGEAVKGNFEPLPITTVKDISWFPYNTDEIGPNGHKLIIDGSEGWLAYLNNDILFVKVFEDTTQEEAAPNEGEIEIYANGENIYIEIEQQGAYATLEPGEYVDWNVHWALANFSTDEAQAIVGNESLVEKTRALVNAVNRD